MKLKYGRYFWAICFGILLTGFTVYAVLDIFVIQRAYKKNATEINDAMFDVTPVVVASPTPSIPEPTKLPDVTPTLGPTSTPTPTPTPSIFTEEEYVSDNYYSNDHLVVSMTDYRVCETNVHVGEIWVTSPRYILSAFAKDTYGMHINEKTTVLAKKKEAVLAINGDNYGQRERGYVIRNGVTYRDKGDKVKDAMIFLANGDFLFTYGSNLTPLKDYVEMDAWHAFSFGPVLLDNGEIMVAKNYEIKDNYGSNPRTGIGMIEPNHYIFLVSDGRTSKNKGLSLYEMADFMKELGCTKAFNLDGGGSSTMVFCGRVVNFPTTSGKYSERAVGDILYVR